MGSANSELLHDLTRKINNAMPTQLRVNGDIFCDIPAFIPADLQLNLCKLHCFTFSSICVSRDYFCFLACILHNRNNFSTVDGIHCMHSLPSPRNISLGTRSGKPGQHGRNGAAPEEIEISKIML